MARVTTLLIGVIIIGMITAGFVMLMGELSDNYSVTYESETFNKLTDKIDNVTAIGLEVKTKNNDIKQDSGIFDIVGDMFGRGFNAFKITFKSFDILSDIVNIGANELGIPSIFTTGIIVIILLVIFVGIVLYAIFKVKV